MNIELRKITADYPYDLLLQADETREGIGSYLFDSEVYVAGVDGKTVGVMCLLPLSADTVELMNIAVDEPFRGRGIGGAMLEEAARIASAKGYREIILGTGTEDCAPDQIRFYERHGFRKSHLRKNYFLEKYPEPIYENGVQLRDMQVLKRISEELTSKNRATMKFNNVRLLVRDYRKCFDFYTQKLGLEPLWDVEECYGAFRVADGIEGLAIFKSDLMAPVVGNADAAQPVGGREKSMVCFEVADVDETYAELRTKGVAFINQPTDMPGWGMRVVHLRDPEENLIELYTQLK